MGRATGLSFVIGVMPMVANGFAEEPRRVIDLSHELSEEIPTFPGGIPLRVDPVATFEQAGYFANALSLGEHTGTHVDAPIHFHQDRLSVDELLPDQLIGPGIVIAIEPNTSANPDAMLDLEDLARWEQAYGRIPAGGLVLIHTGWGTRWPDEAAYRNADDQGLMHFPGLSPGAARLLIDRRIKAVGIDTLSIDRGTSARFDAHKILAEANVIVMENLTNLDELPVSGFTVVVAPLKIRGGSGSPARVLAILGNTEIVHSP